MEHDEKEFEARANRIARGMWLAILLVCGWVLFIAGCIYIHFPACEHGHDL